VRVEVPPRLGSKPKPIAYCPEIHDLVLSKLAAGRERDIDYAREAKAHGLVDPTVLSERVGDMPVRDGLQDTVSRLIAIL